MKAPEAAGNCLLRELFAGCLFFLRCIILGIIIQEVFKTFGDKLTSFYIQVQIVDKIFIGIIFGNAAVQVIHEGYAVDIGGVTFLDHISG